MGACMSAQDDAQKQQQQRTTHTRRPSQRHLHQQASLNGDAAAGDVASKKGTSSRRGLHRKGKSVGQALDGSVGGIGVTDAQFAETLSLRLGGVDLAAAARREQQAVEEGDASQQTTWAKPSSRTPRDGEGDNNNSNKVGLQRVSSRKGIGLSGGEAVSAAPPQDERLSSLKKGRHTRSSSSPALTLRLLVPPPDGGEQGLGSSRASPHRPSGLGGRVLGLGNAGGGGGIGGGGGSPRHSARRGGHSRSNSVSRVGMVVRASEEEEEAVNAAVAAVVASGAANVSGLLDEMLLRNNTPSPPPSTAMELRGAQLLSTPSSRAAMAKTADDLTRAMEPVVVLSPNGTAATASAALLTPPSPLPVSAHIAGSSSLAPPSPLHSGGDGTSPVSPVSPAIPSSVLLGLGLNSGRSRPRGLQPGGLAQQIMQRNAVEAYISTATASFKDREQNKEGSPLSRTTTQVQGVPVPLTPKGELPPSLAHVTLLRPPSATRSASDQQTPINHSRSMGSLRGNSFMSFLGGASSAGSAQQSPDPAAALQRRLDAQLVLMGAEQGGSSRTLLNNNSGGPESSAGASNDNVAAAAGVNGIGSLRGRSSAAGTPKSAHTRSLSVDVGSLRNSMASSKLLQPRSDPNDERLPSTEQLWEHYAGGASATHLSKKGLHQLSEDVFEEFCARYRADLQQQADKRGRKDYTTEQREADLARELPFLLPTPKSSRPATPSKATTIAAAASASPNSPEEAATAQEAARSAAMLRRDAHVSFIYKYCLLHLKKSAGSRVATAVNESLDGGLGSLKLSRSMASLHRRNKSHGGILQTGIPGSPKTLSRSPSSASLSDELVTKLEFAVGWPACYINLFAPLDEATGATAMAAKQGSPCRLM